MKVALIVGHSKTSQGARNKSLDIKEFGFNADLAERITKAGKDSEMEFVTVYRDTYSKLPGKVNRENADIIISLHCNAYNEKASGTETLYYHSSDRGRALAGNINYQMVKALGLPNRGTKAKSSEDRGGYLLKYTNAPCVITEAFFIDNDEDLAVAMDNLDELAKSIVQGCNDYNYGIVR